MGNLTIPRLLGTNFLGDRFNQAMAGINAMDPAIFARTHSVLSGESAIKSANGLVLDKPNLDKVIKQFGINYSVNDFFGNYRIIRRHECR